MRFFTILLLTLIVSKSFSQEEFPALSARGSIEQKVGFTTLQVEYERPAARGRKVFGELVPYEKIWRTGAGYCPKLSFDTDVNIGGKTVKAGKYSLLTIPSTVDWVIIINKDTTLYGIDSYNEKLDIVRFKVKSETSNRYYESFTIDIDIVPNDAEIYLSWENCQVHFRIQTNSDRRTSEFIQRELITGNSNNPDEYATAAEYYFYQNKELEKALSLIEKAIKLKEQAWYYRLKTDILESQKKYEEAITLLQSLVIAAPRMSKKFGWSSALEKEMTDGYNSKIDFIKKKLAQKNDR